MQQTLQKDIGLKATIHHGATEQAIHVPHVIGKHTIYSLLVAWGIGRLLNIPIETIVKQYKTYKTPDKRMNLVQGISHTTLIDSSYNAEPSSMKAAFQTLKDISTKGRMIAVIGDMLELGSMEEV